MSKNPWFARIREGLFKDPSGKHRKQMGEAIWLYGYLHICADLETGEWRHTYKSISDATGIPKSTARKMMDKLKNIPPGETEGYIKVRQLSRSLYLQITKWNPTRVPKSGHSENGEGAHIRENGCPSVERVPKSGHSLNNGNNEGKTPRVPKSGHSYKTLNKTQKKREKNLSISSDSKHPKPTKKAAKKTNPNIRAAIGHYRTEYFRIREEQPFLNGTAQKTFKWLLEGDKEKQNPPIQIGELKEIITAYLSQQSNKLIEAGFPIEWLPGNINGLLLKEKPLERGLVL